MTLPRKPRCSGLGLVRVPLRCLHRSGWNTTAKWTPGCCRRPPPTTRHGQTHAAAKTRLTRQPATATISLATARHRSTEDPAPFGRPGRTLLPQHPRLPPPHARRESARQTTTTQTTTAWTFALLLMASTAITSAPCHPVRFGSLARPPLPFAVPRCVSPCALPASTHEPNSQNPRRHHGFVDRRSGQVTPTDWADEKELNKNLIPDLDEEKYACTRPHPSATTEGGEGGGGGGGKTRHPRASVQGPASHERLGALGMAARRSSTAMAITTTFTSTSSAPSSFWRCLR